MSEITKEQIRAALDAEHAAFKELLPRISDEQWGGNSREDGWLIHDIIAHVADSSYGLAWLVQNGAPAGGMGESIDDRNIRRREEMRQMSRAQVEERVESGFAFAFSVLNEVADLTVPGPFGPDRTAGDLLMFIALHNRSHREEITALLG